MTLASFQELQARADHGPRVTVAAAGAADPTVLQALAVAPVRPLLVGNAGDIRRTAAQCALDLADMPVIDATEVAEAAADLVHAGKAQLLMKGQVDTPALVRAILTPHRRLRTGHVIGQVVLIEIVPQNRRFLLVDTGICIAPTVEQKADLLCSAVAVAQRLGCKRPRVAVVAASEKVHPSMPETEDAAELQRRGEAGEFGSCDVQGPLSFDLAYAPDAGTRKGITGAAVGAADILLFPNLVAANLTVKAIMYTADCRFGGVLVGASCPVAFMSRADDVPTRLNSLALALCLLE
jgi:phosphotransacetylase